MAQNGNITRTWHEWEWDANGRHGVLVFETNLQLDPAKPGYSEDAIRSLLDWINKTEEAKPLPSAKHFRIVPKHRSDG